MKQLLKLIPVVIFASVIMAGCDKVDDNPFYNNGNAPALTASSSVIAPALTDSSNTAVTFRWDAPKYATDSATVKYTLQIDSAGKSFVNPYFTKTVTGTTMVALLGKEVTQLLIDRNLQFNTPYDLDVRVISSYGNNNEPLISNVIRVKMSAYVTPPKITTPFTNKLFIVGAATQGGWNTPVPTPTQEFARYDSVTYVGVFNMNGSNEFLLLPESGNFNNKYSLENNNLPGVETAGDFGYNKPSNFKGPVSSGWYKISIDFQRGKYKIEPYVGAQIPSTLFIVGSATPGSWNTPVPVPSQQFTRLNSVQFVINSLPITVGGEYLLLPDNNFNNKYAVPNTSTASSVSGFMGYNLNGNFPGPSVAGNYKMEVDFGKQDKDAGGNALNNTAFYKNTKL